MLRAKRHEDVVSLPPSAGNLPANQTTYKVVAGLDGSSRLDVPTIPNHRWDYPATGNSHWLWNSSNYTIWVPLGASHWPTG